MTITSAGTFKLEGTTAAVDDRRVTATAIILTGFQNQPGEKWHSLSGFLGVTSREPGFSFDFEAPREGRGATVGYIIVEP